MKKFGIIIFIVAIAAGVAITNFLSLGETSSEAIEFSVNRSVRGSGNIISEIREVSDFSGIDVSNAFVVEVVAQKDFEVEVFADDNLLPLIETSVNNGVLEIHTKEGVKSSSPILVRVHAPNIENVIVSGASHVNLSDLNNQSLSLDSSGASRIDVAGTTGRLKIDVSGASHVSAENLKATIGDVEASGASNVDIFVLEKLASHASGASRITYSGNPSSVDKDVSGVSHISQK